MKAFCVFLFLTISSLGNAEVFEYQAKDYSHLIGMQGFSDSLMKMHFELYQGYVKNINMLLNRLNGWDLQNKSLSYDYAALKRRVGWEFDGMRLHELYFDNLGGKDKPENKNGPLYQQLEKDFGSFAQWKKDFVATGLMRGIGWVILYRDPSQGQLVNTWIEEHDLGHLAGCTPLLVMDVWEHAYITQYALDRAKYIDAFFDNINWPVVAERYNQSHSIKALK